MSQYIPKHFAVWEFVPRSVFDQLGDRSLWLMDDRILATIDAVREYFNVPVTVNNWHSGGDFNYRGYRPMDYPQGAHFSQHRCGRAIDFDVQGHTAEQVRQEIIVQRDRFSYITAMEAGTNWVHIDCRNCASPDGKIIMFDPAYRKS